MKKMLMRDDVVDRLKEMETREDEDEDGDSETKDRLKDRQKDGDRHKLRCFFFFPANFAPLGLMGLGIDLDWVEGSDRPEWESYITSV